MHITLNGDSMSLQRRRALTKLSGLAAGTALLPQAWVKPIISSMVLPAHAQTSPDTTTPAGTISLSGNCSNISNLNAGDVVTLSADIQVQNIDLSAVSWVLERINPSDTLAVASGTGAFTQSQYTITNADAAQDIRFRLTASADNIAPVSLDLCNSQVAGLQCGGTTGSMDYTTPGTFQFTVPGDAGTLCSVTATVLGAGGGSVNVSQFSPGGRGGLSSATLELQAGDQLTIIVGATGVGQVGGSGYGNGGSAVVPLGGGSGGGGSAILLGTTPLLIAGGGGGSTAGNFDGGDGGGSAGENGLPAASGPVGGSGGVGGAGTIASSGTGPGFGGPGGPLDGGTPGGAGGGGGGGYGGGGGGINAHSGAGGGGLATGTNASTVTGGGSGPDTDGRVTISW